MNAKRTSVDQGKAVNLDFDAAVFVELREIRGCGDLVVFSGWEGPSAPLLSESFVSSRYLTSQEWMGLRVV